MTGWVGCVGGSTGGSVFTGCDGCFSTCVVTHPASINVTKAADASKLARINDMGAFCMWVIFVEAGSAMFLFVFIVWWTMFFGKKPEPPPEQHIEDETGK